MYVSEIEKLIRSRIQEIGITCAQLIKKSGYANESKGVRRLESIFASDFETTRGLIEKLPAALDLPKEQIEAAIAKTKQDNADYEEAEWRAAFKPNARILTEENGRPRQITMAAISNAGRTVVMEFPDELPAVQYLEYVLTGLPDQLREAASFFYPPTGFVINWSPDRASKYDLNGVLIEELPRAFRGGALSFTLK
ncbi:MAG: hypothetical protein ACOYBW_05500 [Fluviibacter phosphoraccumulans]